MPTLFKHSNGIYYIVLVDKDGKRRWISTNERVKSKAIKRLLAIEDLPKRRITNKELKQFIDDFLDYATKIYSSGTVDIYKKSLRAFLRQTGDIHLSTVNARHIDMFKAKRLEEVSPVTLNIELRLVKPSPTFRLTKW